MPVDQGSKVPVMTAPVEDASVLISPAVVMASLRMPTVTFTTPQSLYVFGDPVVHPQIMWGRCAG